MSGLVFGVTGQVAMELGRLAPDLTFLSRQDVDLERPDLCRDRILLLRPEFVINAAAFTKVDHAEEEWGRAQTVNADAPGMMAQACAEIHVPFVHLSTDYVFDGSGETEKAPADQAAPLNAYGTTKLAGENLVVAAGGTYAVVRTSWVFSAHGRNFVKTMLDLSRSRDVLSIVDDQIGGPTPAREIASAALTIATALVREPSLSGIYHFAGRPALSWAEFAREIFQMANCNVAVIGIPSADYPTPAERPKNTRLDCRATKEAFGLDGPDWRIGLRAVLDELGAT